ncbi:MAG: membrane dipeptidase [Rhodocyclaceae bacterium]|nr:membrane dipeptidase [Rhodocyclaceae bacterium]
MYQLTGGFEARVAEDMIAGSMGAVCFSGVADFSVLDVSGDGLSSVRKFSPGEAWAYYQTQIANLKTLVTQGLVHPVLAPKDMATARASGKPGCIFAVEGGDFVEDDPARIATAFADGVRMITLVHF